MKEWYVKSVWVDDISRMNSILTKLRVGINDFVRSGVYDHPSGQYVAYSIYCDNTTSMTIDNLMYRL